GRRWPCCAAPHVAPRSIVPPPSCEQGNPPGRPSRRIFVQRGESTRPSQFTIRSPSMRYMRYASLLGVVACLAVGIYLWAADKKPAPDKQREAANKAAKDGNFNDAYKTIRPIAIDKKADPEKVAADLTLGLNCLERLGRVDEVDEFREAVILNHPKNWKLLKTAALSYINERQSFGYIVAG